MHSDPAGARAAGRPEDPRRALGRKGEALAAAHLRELGFTLLALNERTREGEIDMIAFDGEALVFVEVKTRRLAPGRRRLPCEPQPLQSLGPRKRARLRRLAGAWLADRTRTRPRARTIRFDAIGVTLGERDQLAGLEHIEGAW
jgi:putative endonuclease